MTTRQRQKTDPLEREIESALQPGVFVPDGASFSFTSGLEKAAGVLASRAQTEPARATSLYEAFYAGCLGKAEEVDDSSGSFGHFAGELLCGWVKARQALGADADETSARLIARMDQDPYGFCYQLEKELAHAFDSAGLSSFVAQVRARFDAATAATPASERPFHEQPEFICRWSAAMLRTLFRERGQFAAYRDLAEETGVTAQDCQELATMLLARRKAGEALSWVERGIELDQKTASGTSARFDLARLKRELLTKLGRGPEAREAAWSEYLRSPNKYTYVELMRFVPRTDRAACHEEAMSSAATARLDSLIELLLHTKELPRLAELIERSLEADLEHVSHYTTEPAARKLEKSRPGLAARLWRAQGMRIVNAGKSKYYDAALANFERAKHCYERAGLLAQWEATVADMRGRHHRKVGLMSDFNQLVAGHGPSTRPSFLKQAKARWGL